MNGSTFSVAQIFSDFAGHTTHPVLRDMADAWAEFGEVMGDADDDDELTEDDLVGDGDKAPPADDDELSEDDLELDDDDELSEDDLLG